MSDRKRLLNDLRVIDLRAELEKRNLDKSGVRGVLIQRLSKHLEEEGHDPAVFTFELSSDKTPTKRAKRAESTLEQDTEDTPAMEDMIVQDDAGEEDESEANNFKPDNANISAPSEKMEVDEKEKLSRKRESKEDSEGTQPKKACLPTEEETKTIDNTDAEDSINLDLGEDELLNEEADNTSKTKQDDGAQEDGDAGTDETAPGDAEPTDDAPADDEQQENNDAAATSNNGEQDDKENKDDKDKDGDDKKEKKDDGKEGGARNLWVSGLSGDTRAKDLKQLCSKHGKVIGAKVVTNARTPGSRCYGYVTMASAQDAENCIKNLHRTELHGRMISVEKAKSESESSSRRQPSGRSDRRSSKERSDGKENEEGKEGGEANDRKKDGEGGDKRSDSRSRDKARSEKDRGKRSTRSRERRRSPREILSFSKIVKERDVARARERSRAAREEERRRRAADEALRERERRQRQEKHRLALERDKLRAEREKIEREKNELLRLERERHRLEREKLELERMELKRAQLRLEEERRKRGYEGAAYRKAAASPPPAPAYESRHKRPLPPMSSSRGQFEAPPPPRFDVAPAYERGDKRDRERDYKRDYQRHVPAANMKYPSNGNSNDDARQPMPPGTRPKEPSRQYEARYRPSPPANKPDQRWNSTTRYPDAATKGKGAGSTGEQWSNTGSGEARYGSGGGGGYEARYSHSHAPAYQPPPPGATYPDRYRQPTDNYMRKY